MSKLCHSFFRGMIVYFEVGAVVVFHSALVSSGVHR